MVLAAMKRVASVSVLTGALVLGVWGGTGGAAPKPPPRYSDDDCTTLLDVRVDDASGGYWGKTALNAAVAFKGAAVDIESKQLRKSMNTLASVWEIVGQKKNPIAAAKATARIGDRYGKALGTYTKAVLTCSSQAVTATTEDTSTADTSATNDPAPTEDTSSSSDAPE